MKNVLIIYKFLPYYRVEFYELLRIKLLKHNISLNLIYGKSNKIDALKKDETEIAWANYIVNHRFFIGKTEILWQPCLSQLKDMDLIIVQPENKLILNYYLMFARHFSKFKLALWGHVYHMQDNVNSFRNKFKLPFLKMCDWWFGYTISAKNYLVAKNYPENKITVVQNAIDTLRLKKKYSEISDIELNNLKYTIGVSGSNVGIFCGSMYPDKDFDFILQTCYRIKKEINDFQMLFVGSGIESTRIIKASETSNWIHFIGPKFGEERVIYFKIATIQIMPKLIGLSILDSFAMETPLITTDHPFHGPEIDYLENGINGIITKNNIGDYSNVIIDLFKTKKYRMLIDGGKVSSDKLTVENMTENFKNGILACLS